MIDYIRTTGFQMFEVQARFIHQTIFQRFLLFQQIEVLYICTFNKFK